MPRTVSKYIRTYIDGYQMAGYTEQIGPLSEVYAEAERAAQSDPVSGALAGALMLNVGVLNGIFDNTPTAGLHAVANGSDVVRNVLVALGELAEPAQGVVAFAAQVRQMAYQAAGEGILAVTIPFGRDVHAPTLDKGFGKLLHAAGAETAVNSAIGFDDVGAATAFGGLFAYQLISSNGTVTLKAQDAATNTNPSFADITGATSGSIDASGTPKSGLVATASGLSIRQFLRWQLVFGTATTATFVAAFLRRFHS